MYHSEFEGLEVDTERFVAGIDRRDWRQRIMMALGRRRQNWREQMSGKFGGFVERTKEKLEGVVDRDLHVG